MKNKELTDAFYEMYVGVCRYLGAGKPSRKQFLAGDISEDVASEMQWWLDSYAKLHG